MQMKFSEKYGYVLPVDVLKRGGLDNEGATALCNCYDHLKLWLSRSSHTSDIYTMMEETIWCFFLNKRRDDFYYMYHNHEVVATKYLLSEVNEWYLKFDLIEYSIKVLRGLQNSRNGTIKDVVDTFVNLLNSTFERLNHAYRIVDDQIVEITDDEEINAIEVAISQMSTVRTHLSNALKQISDRSNPDYRNSIKESISAVEALCREITGENTLGAALNKLEKTGLVIPISLKSGFDKLYAYTNNSSTGIRHALMDDANLPTYDEAKFMIVICSAFINYIQGKKCRV